MRETDVLDEDDLDLIAESRGLPTAASRADDEERARASAAAGAARVQARNEKELSQSLFTGDTDDEDDEARVIKERSKPARGGGEYDEDGLDDFIEDDVGGGEYGDDVAVAGAGRGGAGGGVSEAQLQEHLDIFGDEFMDFYAESGGGRRADDDEEEDDGEYIDGERRDRYRERGVGVQYGVDSDEEVESDSDEDSDDGSLFGEEEDDDAVGGSGADRAEVLRLKREKKKLNREERRKSKREKAEQKRRARLRRAFEPVQLVENFCTERDDAIRMADVPERFYPRIHDGGKKKKRDPPPTKGEATPDEQEEAHWIAARVPAIERELLALSNTMVNPGEEPPTDEQIQEKESAVLDSIVLALRYMRGENLEPDFVKRYRADTVASPAVRDNLNAVLDEDAEWERLVESRGRVAGVLAEEAGRAKSEADGDDDDDDDSGGGRDAELIRLRRDLRASEDKLRGSRAEKERLGKELAGVDAAAAAKKEEDEDDDDDDLFGEEEDDDAVSFYDFPSVLLSTPFNRWSHLSSALSKPLL